MLLSNAEDQDEQKLLTRTWDVAGTLGFSAEKRKVGEHWGRWDIQDFHSR